MQLNMIVPLTLVVLPILSGQPSTGLKRVTPPPGSVPPLFEQYDFGGQLRTLEDSGGLAAGVKPELVTPGVRTEVPKDYRPKSDIPLTATALEAVRVSESWQGEKNPPSPGPDGRVMYSYGAGLPTVVCAPLRVCIVELEAGEKIVGEPHIGDSVRWNISPAMYGTGDQATAVIILKPQTPGLDTNLLITTDRRAYYVRLVSKANDYVSRVAFVYNDDDGGKKWKDHFAEQKREEIAAARSSVQTQPAVLFSVERLHFDYQIKGGDENIRPQRVFDDGSKTYIQMSPNVANREAPVLMVVGADGKGEVVNYRMKDMVYIVDRLFEHAQLVLGSGKKAQKVEITRDHRG